jgi:hypothetical protein
MSAPVAARSKTWVCGRSFAEIVGSNTARGMGMSIVSVVCCQVEFWMSVVSVVCCQVEFWMSVVSVVCC